MISRKKTQQTLEALREEMAAIRTEMAEQMAVLASERTAATTVAERITGLEARVSGMGSELSRQLHELGTDIEELTKRAQDTGVAEIIDALKATQIRLATEQARYEITFREDLASLANQLLKRQ